MQASLLAFAHLFAPAMHNSVWVIWVYMLVDVFMTHIRWLIVHLHDAERGGSGRDIIHLDATGVHTAPMLSVHL